MKPFRDDEEARPQPDGGERNEGPGARGMSLAALVSALVSVGACSSTGATPSPVADAGPTPPARVDFPKDMLWGSATAGFQGRRPPPTM